MNGEASGKTWEKTRLQNLVRHKSGRYYARLFRDSKEIWKSLKTTHFSVAEARLAVLQKEHRETKGKVADPSNAKMNFGGAAMLHIKSIDESTTLKKRTKKYWKDTLAALYKSWPELAGKEIRKLTKVECREWAHRYGKTASAARFNNTLSLLRHTIDVAIELGIVYGNVAIGLERKTIHQKKLTLPTLQKFAEFIAEMRRAHSRDSKNCADLAEGLAYTGLRIGEAAEVARCDIDFKTGEIRVAGDPEEGTKNGEVRYVPLIPQARELFSRMLECRPDEQKISKLFLVHECQKSIDRAAEKVGMVRITHHDLRHFFATVCIESGVDIPTVSRWLGHKDGGSLAMKTYGHLRREHSIAQALKVSFEA